MKERFFARWVGGPVIGATLFGYFWLLSRDHGMRPLFSERYGYVRVWRFAGMKLSRRLP